MTHAKATLIFAAAIAATLASAPAARATITPVPGGSGAWGYFGSQGTAYQSADPTTTFTPATPGGPYTPGIPLPNVPSPPPSVLYPSVYANNFFTGAGYTFNFIDPLAGSTQFTAATTTIDHTFNPSGTLTSDASIAFPNWRFTQGPAAPSYAYEQIDFVAQYQVTNALAASTPTIPLTITGSVSPLGTPFAQFDSAITYTWIPTNSAFVQNGAPTTLGTLNYSWLTGSSGFFLTTVNNTGSLLSTPSSLGVLELTGYAYVTGDPFDIDISSVPEPTSLAILGLGAAAMLRRRRV